ncbi:gluconokinase NDAI_0C05170 [Naumovozyma dairenensis CBS 421]|uniref:Gluconokinase n=1 Tax=Naumovozyma dairenensis (strain ATCC 10597 / BCRC 20456 / CBS 421 / NBRC 0211 / NRRL Y-12639) TaxID=1071378 RepID=G0W8R5_NAUDC|nr:hypothetical protein NDAI_0C05170 [Naumovozyma dairenensis CBS 421]CCD24176.1 hypothetical protein NDAI_0C05170 [Naumovozyma dairenensis CBS 421]
MTTTDSSTQREKIIVLAGTAGTGKSTIADLILRTFKKDFPKLEFVEGDDLHPAANVEKMSHGIPLGDEDRWGWLEKIAETAGSNAKKDDGQTIISCSSLKKKYRDRIRNVWPNGDFYFIFLYASKIEILRRLKQRMGHFMKENMMESQFNDLELPDVEKEQHCFIVKLDGKTFEHIEDETIELCSKILKN